MRVACKSKFKAAKTLPDCGLPGDEARVLRAVTRAVCSRGLNRRGDSASHLSLASAILTRSLSCRSANSN